MQPELRAQAEAQRLNYERRRVSLALDSLKVATCSALNPCSTRSWEMIVLMTSTRQRRSSPRSGAKLDHGRADDSCRHDVAFQWTAKSPLRVSSSPAATCRSGPYRPIGRQDRTIWYATAALFAAKVGEVVGVAERRRWRGITAYALKHLSAPRMERERSRRTA